MQLYAKLYEIICNNFKKTRFYLLRFLIVNTFIYIKVNKIFKWDFLQHINILYMGYFWKIDSRIEEQKLIYKNIN